MARERAVVCLSGGMDSTVCAALAARDYDTFGLHLSYGQRTEARELGSARSVARLVGLGDLLELQSDLFRRIGGSAARRSRTPPLPSRRPAPKLTPAQSTSREPVTAPAPPSPSPMSPSATRICSRRRSVGRRCWAPRVWSLGPSSRTAPATRTAARPTMTPSTPSSPRAHAMATSASKPRSFVCVNGRSSAWELNWARPCM